MKLATSARSGIMQEIPLTSGRVRAGGQRRAIVDVLLLLILIAGLTAVNAVWLAQDRHAPSGDEHGYLLASLTWLDLLSDRPASLADFVDQALDIRWGARPALYMLLGVPVYVLFGRAASVDHVVLFANTLVMAALVLSTYGIGRYLFAPQVGLLAAFVIAIAPETQFLSHVFLQHFGMIAAVAATVYFLLRTENFTRPGYAIAFGFALGLSALTRPMFALYLVGICAFVAAGSLALAAFPESPSVRRWVFEAQSAGGSSPREAVADDWVDSERAKSRQRSVLKVSALTVVSVLIASAIAAPWYVRHWDSILGQGLGDGFFGTQLRATGVSTLLERSWLYLRGLPGNLSAPLVALALVGLVLALARPSPARLLMVIWFVTSVVASSSFIGVYYFYLAPTYIPLAVLAVHWIPTLRLAWQRSIVVGLVLVSGIAVVFLSSWTNLPSWVRGGDDYAWASNRIPMDEAAWPEATNEAIRWMAGDWHEGRPIRLGTLSQLAVLQYGFVSYQLAVMDLPPMDIIHRWPGTAGVAPLLDTDYVLTQSPLWPWAEGDGQAVEVIDRFFEAPPDAFSASHQLAWQSSLPDGTAAQVYKRVRPVTPDETIGVTQAMWAMRPAEFLDYIYLGNAYAETGETARAIQVLSEAREKYPLQEEAYLLLADLYLEAGNDEQALGMCQRALELNPKSAWAMTAMGRVYASSSQLESGISWFERALQADPKYVTAHIHMAEAYKALDKRDKAIAEYNEAMRLEPDNIEAIQSLALAYKDWQQTRKAIDLLRKAIGIDPHYARGYVYLSLCYQELGDLSQARQVLEEGTRTNPSFADAHSHLGSLYMSAGDTRGAIDQYQQALALDPKVTWAYTSLAWAYMSQARLPEAITVLETAIENASEPASAYAMLGDVYREEGQGAQAEEAYRKAIESDANHVAAYRKLGALFQSEGRFDEAVQVYSQAIQLAPSDAAAHVALGRAYLAYNAARPRYYHRDQAEREARAALELDPSNFAAYTLLGDVEIARDNPEQAIQYYETAVQLDPHAVTAFLTLGALYLHQGQANKAEASFQQARELSPDQAEISMEIGSRYLLEGFAEAAIEESLQAVDLEPGAARYRVALGDAYREAGRLDEMIAAWEEALRLDPDYAHIHYKLGWGYEQKGMVERALAEYERELIWSEQAGVDDASTEETRRLLAALMESSEEKARREKVDRLVRAGDSALEKGEFDRAIEAYQQLVDLEPEVAAHHIRLGDVHLRTGMIDDVIREWEEALRLDPDYPEIHFKLGWAYEQQGWNERAIAEYEKHLEMSGDRGPYAELARSRIAALRQAGSP